MRGAARDVKSPTFAECCASRGFRSSEGAFLLALGSASQSMSPFAPRKPRRSRAVAGPVQRICALFEQLSRRGVQEVVFPPRIAATAETANLVVRIGGLLHLRWLCSTRCAVARPIRAAGALWHDGLRARGSIVKELWTDVYLYIYTLSRGRLSRTPTRLARVVKEIDSYNRTGRICRPRPACPGSLVWQQSLTSSRKGYRPKRSPRPGSPTCSVSRKP